MANPATNLNNDDVEPPITTPTTPNPPESTKPMEGIETSDSFAYETTIQFYDPNANSTTLTPQPMLPTTAPPSASK